MIDITENINRISEIALKCVRAQSCFHFTMSKLKEIELVVDNTIVGRENYVVSESMFIDTVDMLLRNVWMGRFYTKSLKNLKNLKNRAQTMTCAKKIKKIIIFRR